MRGKAGTLFFLALWLISFGGSAVAAGPCQAEVPENSIQGSPHARGVAHFERGFYECLPKNLKAEAAQEFELAVTEFEKSLSLEPGRTQTHRLLARIYRLQEKFLLAARHFQKVTDLDPGDIDAYVLAADALAEAGQLGEAELMLQKAKAQTAEPKAVRTLDELLLKLADAKREAGLGK